jgi:hypothetical protein
MLSFYDINKDRFGGKRTSMKMEMEDASYIHYNP